MLKCFVFFELFSTHIDWQSYLQRTLLGLSFKRSCQAFERPSWSNHSSTYISNLLSLLMSSWAPNLFQPLSLSWPVGTTFPFFHCEEKSFIFPPPTYFCAEAPLLNRAYIPWVKKNNGIQCVKLPSWNIPVSLAGSHFSDHYKWSEWANATGFWMCYVCLWARSCVCISLLGENTNSRNSAQARHNVWLALLKGHHLHCIAAHMQLEATNACATEARLHKVVKTLPCCFTLPLECN